MDDGERIALAPLRGGEVDQAGEGGLPAAEQDEIGRPASRRPQVAAALLQHGDVDVPFVAEAHVGAAGDMGDVPGARALQRGIARPMGHAEPVAAQGHGRGVELPFLGQPVVAARDWRGRKSPCPEAAAARSARVRRSSASFSIAARNSMPVNAGSRVPLPLGRIVAVNEWQGKR